MLCDRHTHADDVNLLKAVSADLAAPDIARDCHDRHRIQICGGDAGNEIGRARTGGRHHDADLSGCAGIAVSGVCRALLVCRQHAANGIAAEVQRVKQIRHLSAGIAEHRITALFQQRFDYDFCTCQIHICPFRLPVRKIPEES